MAETIKIHLPDTTIGPLSDKVFLHDRDDGTLLNAGGDVLSQSGNSLYQFTLDEARDGTYRASVRTSGNTEIWYGWLAPGETMIHDVLSSGGGSGAGMYEVELTIKKSNGQEVAGCDVVLTLGASSPQSGIYASGVTNASGMVTMYVDPGVYYIWRQKQGVNFADNPRTLTVSDSGSAVVT